MNMSNSLDRRTVHAVVTIVIVIIASLTVIFILQPQNQSELDIVLTVNVGDSSTNYTLDDLTSLPSVTGNTGFVKTGTYPPVIGNPTNWTGVPVLHLLSLVDNLPANHSLQILSADGYMTYFNMTEVQGSVEAYNSTTGESIGPRDFTMVLAYKQNGEFLTNETGGPLRLALIPEGDYVSAGHSWPKLVRKITIIDETDPWSLELKGVNSWNMTHDVYYSLGSCPHHRKNTTLNDVRYFGVALWTIISSMDGGNDVHYSFNNSLVSTNYTVTVWSDTGSHLNFTSYDIAFNNNLILAGWADEMILVPPEWPLKLVTAGGLFLDNIVRIEMSGWQS